MTTSTKRAREDSSAASSVSVLKKQHDDLFIEITKRLNYTADGDAHAALLANFAHLRLSGSDPNLFKDALDEAFIFIGEGLSRAHAQGACRETNPALLDKWHIAFQLRTAILHASPLHVNVDPDVDSSLQYYPGLPNVEKVEILSPVVLRQEDETFWQSCLEVSKERKVCCVGVPGIGKTTTTFHLIKTLIMEEMKTVVYAIQQPPPVKSVYMKFVPVLKDAAVNVVDITVNCVQSDQDPQSIFHWSDGDYYIVDPGNTKVSCDVSFGKNIHLVLVSSCDSRHWGQNEFGKMRSRAGRPSLEGIHDVSEIIAGLATQQNSEDTTTRTFGGMFVYCRTWALKDIIDCRHLLGLDKVTPETICSRYRVTGGSVRKILDYKDDTTVRQTVETALDNLPDKTIHALADGRCHGAFDVTAPESCLVSVEPDEGNSSHYHLFITSDLAEEVIAEKHLKLAWYAVLNEDNSGNQGNLFKAFVRHKLAAPIELKMGRYSSPNAPSNGNKKTKKNYLPSSTVISLQARRKIVRVINLAESVKRTASDDTLFYSKDESEPLIDMICRFDRGFLAVQVTIRRKHDAETAKIAALVNALALGEGEKLVIVYAVPQNRLAEFETAPVNPLLGQTYLAEKVEIYHLAIDD